MKVEETEMTSFLPVLSSLLSPFRTAVQESTLALSMLAEGWKVCRHEWPMLLGARAPLCPDGE